MLVKIQVKSKNILSKDDLKKVKGGAKDEADIIIDSDIMD